MTGVLIVYVMRNMFFTFLIENVMGKSSRGIFLINIAHRLQQKRCPEGQKAHRASASRLLSSEFSHRQLRSGNVSSHLLAFACANTFPTAVILK